MRAVLLLALVVSTASCFLLLSVAAQDAAASDASPFDEPADAIPTPEQLSEAYGVNVPSLTGTSFDPALQPPTDNTDIFHEGGAQSVKRSHSGFSVQSTPLPLTRGKIYHDVKISDITADGWQPCYSNKYSSQFHEEDMVAACKQASGVSDESKLLIMVGCGSSIQTSKAHLLAYSSLATIKSGGSNFAIDNEVAFYDTVLHGFGFMPKSRSHEFPLGLQLACDLNIITAPNDRLCWHNLPHGLNPGGFRCGVGVGLVAGPKILGHQLPGPGDLAKRYVWYKVAAPTVDPTDPSSDCGDATCVNPQGGSVTSTNRCACVSVCEP